MNENNQSQEITQKAPTKKSTKIVVGILWLILIILMISFFSSNYGDNKTNQ